MDKQKLEKEIEEIIAQSKSLTDPVHSITTRKWLLELKPDADYAHQIAALAHDIERGHTRRDAAEITDYIEHKKRHAKTSADVISDLLRKYDADKEFMDKVYDLVLHHEVGGSPDSDVLMNADSISFFEGNLEAYFYKKSKDTVEFKIRYMFDRMSDEAKCIIRKFTYENQELDNLFREVVSK